MYRWKWSLTHQGYSWLSYQPWGLQVVKVLVHMDPDCYSETLNNEYIKRIYQMSYSLLSDNGMLQIFSFLIKWLYGTL